MTVKKYLTLTDSGVEMWQGIGVLSPGKQLHTQGQMLLYFRFGKAVHPWKKKKLMMVETKSKYNLMFEIRILGWWL